jgi:hypothetical protein
MYAHVNAYVMQVNAYVMQVNAYIRERQAGRKAHTCPGWCRMTELPGRAGFELTRFHEPYSSMK